MTSVFIATPSYKPNPHPHLTEGPNYRGLDGQFAVSVEATRAVLEQHGIASVFARFDAMMVDRARAEAVGAFLASDCTHLHWRDADIVAAPNVLGAMLGANKPIAAAVYRRRGGLPGDWPVRLGPGETLADLRYEIDGAGNRLAVMRSPCLGCSLMTRAAVEQVCAAHPEQAQASWLVAGRLVHALFAPMIVSGEGLSDDYSFCERAARASVAIYVLIDAEIEHDGLIGRLSEVLQ